MENQNDQIRTDLARERTKLAYIRTSFTSLIAGVTLFKLFNGSITDIIGYTLVLFSIVLFGMSIFKLSVRNI